MSRRAYACVSLFLAFSGIASTTAAAAGRHAALILDANTGAVLHNVEGDAPRHPASLTKMMTLYLTFETLQSGRLRMSDRITISEHAADAAPSKLDLDPGDEISVEDAIKAVVTKSANDVAVALAEKIGGSEPNFAHLMNARAREFGMTGTHYENASGLPNDDQITTARDMATLALHLQDDFPQYYPFFSTRVFAYEGKSYRNHNTMLNSFAGVDGIKTGYTRASGFNLVTSWRRGNRHLVGVVFGGDTAGERNAEMRTLLTRMVTRASPIMTRKPMMLARLKSEPRMALRPLKHKPEIKVAEAPAVAPIRAEGPQNIDDNNAETPVHIFKVRTNPIVMKVSPQAPSPDETTDMEDSGRSPEGTAPPVLQRPPFPHPPKHFAETRQASHPPIAAADPPPPRPVQAKRKRAPAQMIASAEMHDPPVMRGMPPSTLGAQARALSSSQQDFRSGQFSTQSIGGSRYTVQIGAYGSIDDAQRALNSAQGRAGRLLAGVSSVTNPAMKDGRQIFRARFTGLDANRASSTCNTLRRQAFDCLVLAGE